MSPECSLMIRIKCSGRGLWGREKIQHQQGGGENCDCGGVGLERYGGSRGQEDIRDRERDGGQPGGYYQHQIDSRLPNKSPRGKSPNFRHGSVD